MSSPIYIPSSSGFNNNPSSTTVRTASYTIPAGKYARVVANLEGSATITINGVTALRGTQNSVLGSSPLNYRVFNNSGAGFRNENISLAMAPTTSDNYTLGSSFSSATDQKTVVQDFWCPTGTVINGTGTWRAIVTEYNT